MSYPVLEQTKQRVNIMLPIETVKLINSIAKTGEKSGFINRAVQHYVESIGKKNLKDALRKGAGLRAKRDLKLAEEWFSLKDEDSKKR